MSGLDNSDFDRPMASMAERTAIVAWLRRYAAATRGTLVPTVASLIEGLAENIERGDHLSPIHEKERGEE